MNLQGIKHLHSQTPPITPNSLGAVPIIWPQETHNVWNPILLKGEQGLCQITSVSWHPAHIRYLWTLPPIWKGKKKHFDFVKNQ